MDRENLKREFRRDLTICDAECDTLNVLPRDTPEQVADQVRGQLDILMSGGGYAFTQVHNIGPHMPAESVVAPFRAAWEPGRYD